MFDYFGDLFDKLHQDQRDALNAKLASGIAASRVAENDYKELVTGLDEDYPFERRMADCATYGAPEWFASCAMSNTLNKLCELAYQQRIMREDLRDVLACL